MGRAHSTRKRCTCFEGGDTIALVTLAYLARVVRFPRAGRCEFGDRELELLGHESLRGLRNVA